MRIILFTPEGHEDRTGTVFNGSFACDNVECTYDRLKTAGVGFKARQPNKPGADLPSFAPRRQHFRIVFAVTRPRLNRAIGSMMKRGAAGMLNPDSSVR